MLGWDELWRRVRTRAGIGPRPLRPAAELAILEQAFRIEAAAGRLGPLGDFTRTRGLCQWIQARFRAWSRAGFEPEAVADEASTEAVLRRLYSTYRSLLEHDRLADEDGFAWWAARRLRDDPRSCFELLDRAVVLEPGDGPTVAAALEGLHAIAGEMVVTLSRDPSRPEAYAATDHLAGVLASWGFADVLHEPDGSRPAGLTGIERRLFPAATETDGPLPGSEGLSALGAPRGEGVGLCVARRVRDLIASGVHPDELAVVVPSWGEAAETIVEILRSWKLPCRPESGRPLANEPGVSAWLKAAALPVGGWERSELVALLRNSRFRPEWSGVELNLAAARALAECRTFRGLDALRDALARRSRRDPAESLGRAGDRRRLERETERARAALATFNALAERLVPCNRQVAWSAHLDGLERLSDELNLFDPGETARDELIEALTDWGVATGLETVTTWEDFVATAARVASETRTALPSGSGREVRVMSAAGLAGTQFTHVILAGLDEGTFPAREAIDLEEEAGGAAPGARYAAAMHRFLTVIGAARQSLTFVYPTTDENGESLLAAGFLDDVRRIVDPHGWAGGHEVRRRLDPILPEELIGSPAERRVRAVALASRGDPGDRLGSLAGDPGERLALAGAAAALLVRAKRTGRGDTFSPFEGRLGIPEIGGRILAGFGPERVVLSASQLESLAFCPFQFFLRYGLNLVADDERGELEEERSVRGSLLHKALELLHTSMMDETEEPTTPAERASARLPEIIQRLVDEQPAPRNPVESALREIQAARLVRDADRYVRQLKDYLAGPGAGLSRSWCEVSFGDTASGSTPALELGTGENAVAIRGIVDRIDLLPREGARLVRVIDYKSGHVPTTREIDTGLALQVPLYLLAAERLELLPPGAQLTDGGYWGIGGKGYHRAVTALSSSGGGVEPHPQWAKLRQTVEAYVLAMVNRVRAADFPVAPCRDDCTRSCDYRSVCRIAEVRRVGRQWRERPILGDE